ncbi:DUF218 domain-containing protein [Anaerovibrio lipolyticus DSM 3074]|uniref:DUF218 domain-containing protein n=1 Tax=Anaerovibrio lipolyticus DSM 3074 TaxID=1120997 RepID=A0A1M6FE27_9FIRM|nr:YdcF family protein [Anaerovibrio lipolyticus]SHI95895.1 DUF218 domain-containing protein [Anaerovibrio lipolyticus DSM 3074]
MITDREKIIAIVDNDCFSKSDAAILLEGDGFFRVNKAAELYRNGLVSKIVFSGNVVDRDYGSYPFEENKPLLLQSGVRESDLIHEDKSTHTRQQAVEVIGLAEKMGWKKLALVASSEHQYRAYLTFLREIIDKKSDIILYNTPARQLNWFQDVGWGMRIDRLVGEFDRIEKYTELGHLATADEVIQYQKWKEALMNESY